MHALTLHLFILTLCPSEAIRATQAKAHSAVSGVVRRPVSPPVPVPVRDDSAATRAESAAGDAAIAACLCASAAAGRRADKLKSAFGGDRSRGGIGVR